jgi:7-keto-8-aminopelargonate synthetase-like enzyme
MEPGDLILFDAFSHNSITVGANLSGAARRPYRHNDLDDLEKILIQTRQKHDRVLIVVEGLYSMDGDIPDLPRLIEIKKRHGAWLMVDDAHALGVLGQTGLGVFEHFRSDPADIDIWMGTLSKTLSGCGGYIAGNHALIEILRYFASGFMFSVGMSPPVAAAASRALELMLEEPERVARLHENGRYFLKAARAAGLDTGLSEGFSIIPVIIGDSLRTVKLCNLLMENGIFTIPVTYPGVPMQEARIRFFITSEHTKEQLQTAIDITARELRRLIKANYGLASIVGSDGGEGA